MMIDRRVTGSSLKPYYEKHEKPTFAKTSAAGMKIRFSPQVCYRWTGERIRIPKPGGQRPIFTEKARGLGGLQRGDGTVLADGYRVLREFAALMEDAEAMVLQLGFQCLGCAVAATMDVPLPVHLNRAVVP